MECSNVASSISAKILPPFPRSIWRSFRSLCSFSVLISSAVYSFSKALVFAFPLYLERSMGFSMIPWIRSLIFFMLIFLPFRTLPLASVAVIFLSSLFKRNLIYQHLGSHWSPQIFLKLKFDHMGNALGLSVDPRFGFPFYQRLKLKEFQYWYKWCQDIIDHSLKIDIGNRPFGDVAINGDP